MFHDLPAPSPVIAIEQFFIAPKSHLAQTSTCTKQEQYNLNQEVSRTCKGPDNGTACKQQPGITSADFLRNALKFEACVVARETINNRCFGGGDLGHITATANARTAAETCRRLIK